MHITRLSDLQVSFVLFKSSNAPPRSPNHTQPYQLSGQQPFYDPVTYICDAPACIDRQMDGQIDRQTDRQIDMDRQIQLDDRLIGLDYINYIDSIHQFRLDKPMHTQICRQIDRQIDILPFAKNSCSEVLYWRLIIHLGLVFFPLRYEAALQFCLDIHVQIFFGS